MLSDPGSRVSIIVHKIDLFRTFLLSIETRHIVPQPDHRQMLEPVGACANLQEHSQQRAGSRVIGLSNVDRMQLDRASLSLFTIRIDNHPIMYLQHFQIPNSTVD